MKLIVGLGNPGKEYTSTRHNAGFLALDYYAKNYGCSDFVLNKNFHALISTGIIHDQKALLVKPQTFMNDSGVSVRAIQDFYKIAINDIVVVHDDKDIPLGEYRWQTDRGSAGHNGIKSIIATLGSKAFARLRLGIAAPPGTTALLETSDFVLGKFTITEKSILTDTIVQSEPLLKEWLAAPYAY